MIHQGHESGTQSGFTLIEVLVALAIVGVGVVTLLEIFSAGMRLESRAAAVTEVMAEGGQIMDQILIRGETAEGSAAGFSGLWKMEFKPWVPVSLFDSPGDWRLGEVTLEIRYSEAGRERRVEMSTLRLFRDKTR